MAVFVSLYTKKRSSLSASLGRLATIDSVVGTTLDLEAFPVSRTESMSLLEVKMVK